MLVKKPGSTPGNGIDPYHGAPRKLHRRFRVYTPRERQSQQYRLSQSNQAIPSQYLRLPRLLLVEHRYVFKGLSLSIRAFGRVPHCLAVFADNALANKDLLAIQHVCYE